MYISSPIEKIFKELRETLDENTKVDASYFKQLLKKNQLNFSQINEYIVQRNLQMPITSIDVKSLSKVMAKLFRRYQQESIADATIGKAIGYIYIAGLPYVSNMNELFSSLKLNERVKLSSEKNNPHDKKAIKISTCNGTKLGYVPKRYNYFPSYMLNSNIALFGVIIMLKWSEQGYEIKVMVYIDE